MALVTKNFSDIITFTRASTGTFFDSAGVLTSASNNVPRFDYDPSTLAAQGLLIEEQRSNTVYPSNFSSIGTVAVNNAWFETFATLDTTVNAGVAPDGTTTAALLAINAATTFNGAIYRTASTTAGTYAFSCFCKANSTDLNARLLLGGDTGLVNNVRADFTLTGSGSAGAATVIGTATAPSAPTIQAIGNGWYRCTIIVALTAPTNITCIVYPGTVGSQTTASQTLFWGAQLEAGAFPTSYIPTTTTALTRSADVASVNTLSPWFNATEGTLYGEITDAAITVSGVSRRIANINDGTEADRITVGWAGATAVGAAFVTDNSVAQASFTSPSGAYPFPTKVALAYKAADFQAAVNGSAFATVSSGTVPTVNRMTIGDVVTGGNGTQNINGHIRRITYYPRRLSQAELTAITA